MRVGGVSDAASGPCGRLGAQARNSAGLAQRDNSRVQQQRSLLRRNAQLCGASGGGGGGGAATHVRISEARTAQLHFDRLGLAAAQHLDRHALAHKALRDEEAIHDAFARAELRGAVCGHLVAVELEQHVALLERAAARARGHDVRDEHSVVWVLHVGRPLEGAAAYVRLARAR